MNEESFLSSLLLGVRVETAAIRCVNTAFILTIENLESIIHDCNLGSDPTRLIDEMLPALVQCRFFLGGVSVRNN